MSSSLTLQILAALWIGLLIHLGGFMATGSLMSIQLREVTLFFGPRLFRKRIGEVDVNIGTIPLGGSVQFSPDSLEIAGRFKLAVLTLSGCFWLFLFAAICRDFTTAAVSTVNGFSQIVLGALSRKESAALLSNLVAYLESSPFYVVLGVVAAKLCAANLLPSPALNGGQFLLAIFNLDPNKNAKILQTLIVVGFLFALVICFGWVFALWTFFRGPA